MLLSTTDRFGDFINIKANELEDLKEAIVTACESRLRPVILTTVTTVVGLLFCHPK